jgi:hypothetical protein
MNADPLKSRPVRVLDRDLKVFVDAPQGPEPCRGKMRRWTHRPGQCGGADESFPCQICAKQDKDTPMNPSQKPGRDHPLNLPGRETGADQLFLCKEA